MAWTARIVLLAQKSLPAAKYEPGSVTKSMMRSLAQLSSLDRGPVLAKEFLANHGIPLIVEPHLAKTHLDGASVMVEVLDRPIVGLTLRFDRLDNFWFCLMHELAHISCHMGESITQFYDNLEVEGDQMEKEADETAEEVLIPNSVWETSPAKSWASPSAVRSLARQLNIHPAIVAGRIRYQRNSFRLLNNLVGHGEVRKHFPEVNWS